MQDKAKSAEPAGDDQKYERAILTHIIAAHPTTLRLSDLIREFGVSGEFSERDAVERAARDLVKRRAAVQVRGRAAADPSHPLPLRTGVGMSGSDPTIPSLPDGITFSTAAERFGWNLRIARHRARLRQQDLADRLGVYQSGVSHWELGKCLPKPRTLQRLSEALGVDPDDLLRGTEGLEG